MYAKLLTLAPDTWVFTYIFSQAYAGEEISLRQLVLEFVLLGRLPATEIYLNFNTLMALIVLSLWAIGVFGSYCLYKLQLPAKHRLQNQY